MAEENEHQSKPTKPAGEGQAYTSEDLQHLSDLEHVRERPACTSATRRVRGLHHLVYEVVDNSIDEAMAGHATTVIGHDQRRRLGHRRRRRPRHPRRAIALPTAGHMSTLEGVMTVLKFGGKFDKRAYKTSGGLHGIGVKVVNFLSEWCEVEVRRDGHVYQQEYERGVPTGRKSAASARRQDAAPRPPSSPTRRSSATPSSTTTRCTAACRNWRSSTGREDRVRDDRTGEGETFQYDRGMLNSSST